MRFSFLTVIDRLISARRYRPESGSKLEKAEKPSTVSAAPPSPGPVIRSKTCHRAENQFNHDHYSAGASHSHDCDNDEGFRRLFLRQAERGELDDAELE